MYKVTITQIRPSPVVRMFGKSSPANEALQAEFDSLLSIAPGYVSSEKIDSEDLMTITRVVLWETKQHFDDFALQQAALITELKAKRDLYNLAVGITRLVTKEEL